MTPPGKAELDRTDLVFQALGSPLRRRMMDLIKQHPGCCLNDVCEHFDISRIAVMKQLKILVGAQLVISKKAGRKREFYFNAAPIQMIYDRWTDEYSAFWVTQAVDLKYRIESGLTTKRSTDSSTPVLPKPETKRKSKRKKGKK